jgi:hypothetical protein
LELHFKRTVFKINFYGTEYEMRKPTVRETVDFQKSLSKDKSEEDKLLRLTSFFVGLGLNKDAVDDMQMDHMIQLAEALSATDKKK